ncbi:MAG: lipoate--protein ligase family protein [Candidatus Altiarchaeota archaeon]|nr:lipoate--protein ligase family protein [Candidatus Altiarchaeota archaeon]
MKCRLIDSGANSAGYNMGLDESILTHISRGESSTTLRFYAWEPKAVSIGYFQNINDEVDIHLCKEKNVDVVRRVTGGGAVYHDMELTYSFITSQDNLPADVLESYKIICGGLVAGFGEFGVKAEFAPLNDVVTGGKKISGNAQTRRMGCVLQHGTILLSVDLQTMFSLLKISSEKIREKMIAAASERVTSLEKAIGRKVAYDEALKAFTDGFQKSMGLEYTRSQPSESEVKYALNLQNTKYISREWNFKR